VILLKTLLINISVAVTALMFGFILPVMDLVPYTSIDSKYIATPILGASVLGIIFTLLVFPVIDRIFPNSKPKWLLSVIFVVVLVVVALLVVLGLNDLNIVSSTFDVFLFCVIWGGAIILLLLPSIVFYKWGKA